MKGVRLIRKDERATSRKVDGEAVGLLIRSEVMEAILVELEPLTGFEGSYRHNGEEMPLVLEREVELAVGEDPPSARKATSCGATAISDTGSTIPEWRLRRT